MLPLTLVALLLLTAQAGAEEPGKNFGTALEISEGEYTYFLELGDFHFFKISLEAGETLIATLRVPRGQDFDIYLLSPMGDLLDQSLRPASLSERVGVLASEPGYYYIVVVGFGDSSGTYYLKVDIIRPKTETMTVEKTLTEVTTETVTAYSLVTVTQVINTPVTVTETEVVSVEKIPWGTLGLLALALSIVYLAANVSSAISKRST